MMSWTGLTEYKAKLKASPGKLQRRTKQDLEQWGRNIEYGAKADAPVDLGQLQQSIHYESTNQGMGAEVSVNVPYAAFVEFGTGAGVFIPPGWYELAAKFRGRGERKVNIPAHFFFLPHVRSETDLLKARLIHNLQTLL